MKFLITGGAGFIGSNLCLKLISKGHDVRVLDNLSTQIHGDDPEKSDLYQSIKNKVEFIHADVCNKEALSSAIDGVDGIFHLAAETGTGQSMYEISRYTDVNITATAHLLELLAQKEKHKVKKVIISSSRAVYGEGKYNCPVHGNVYPLSRVNDDMAKGDFTCKCPYCGETVELLETDEYSQINASSVYGITKYAQEQLLFSVCTALGIDIVGLRYQNVYGPGQSLKNPYTGILSIFSTRVRNNNDILIFEDGQESRDFVYIDDVVEATFLSMMNKDVSGEVINVGTGNPISVQKVAATIKNFFSDSTSVIKNSGNYRVGDIRHNKADISKLKEVLGFEPKVQFEKGIVEFLNWVMAQEIQEDRFERSISELKEKGLYK